MSLTPEQINSRPWLYKKGQSGNPSGKKRGTISMKEWAKKMLQGMNEEQRQKFVDGLSKDIIWKMAEGLPKADVDQKLSGEVTVKVVKYGKSDNATVPL